MLCVLILPVYLLSISVYLCLIFIWDMKKTDVGRGVILKYLLLTTYIHFFKKHTSKMSAKCAQQSMILTYQIFCVLNPLSLQGLHDSLLPSISKHLEKFTILTD